MTKPKLLYVILLATACCLLHSCAGGKPSVHASGFTAEFRAFLDTRETDNSDVIRDSLGGYQFTLENGRLAIIGTEDNEIWHSKDEWYVDSFRLGDVNSDGIPDAVFSVWKSYSFGSDHPARMANDDTSVRCHLFVYSVKDNRVKSLWCSSNLPRPIYSFELNSDGSRTPIKPGVRLTTSEGVYTEDFSKTEPVEYTYEWNGWGFSPITIPSEPPEEISASYEHITLRAEIAVAGDLMCHEAQQRDALTKGGGERYDFTYAFRYIAPYISGADYAIGNLEATIALPGNKPSGYPAFGAPEAFAEAIKAAGFDLVTTANNHALDFGMEGLSHTLRVLDGVGLRHTGTYDNKADSDEITVISVNGITFAILSYTYGTNGNQAPQNAPWCVNGPEKIADDIARAKSLEPDIIIVMPHMGTEYETAVRQIYKDAAYDLLKAGADLVLASHPHVLQPAEFVTVTDDGGRERKCFIAYSLGNFISSQRTAPCDYGMIASLSFVKSPGGKAELDSVALMPVWVKFTAPDGSYDITVLPAGELDKPEFSDAADGLSAEDMRRIDDVNKEFSGMFSKTG